MNFLRFVFRRLYLFFYLLKKHFFRMFFSSIGLLISLVVVFSILGILRPLKKMVIEKVEGGLPAYMLTLKAPAKRRSLDVMIRMLRREKNVALGIPASKIKPMYKWPEVSGVYRTQVLQKPLVGTFDHPVLSKMGIYFDFVLQGVSREMVQKDLKCRKKFRPSTMVNSEGKRVEVVPLVLPQQFADIAYAYSVVNDLPAVDQKALIGLLIKITIGESVATRSRGRDQKRPTRVVYGEVCGFVSQNVVTIAGVPMEWVRSLHLKSRQNIAANHYDHVFLRVDNPRDLPAVEKKIASLGLLTERPPQNYNKLFDWLDKIDLVLWGVAGVLLLLSAIALFNSFMILTNQKRYEFGLYLVFGASPVFLWVLMFAEGAFWGAFHSIIAYWIAANFSGYLQEIAGQIPMFAAMAGEKSQFLFTISSAEKFYLIAGTTAFAGLSSLLAALYLSLSKTILLVKKD